MKKYDFKQWLKAAGIRAIKTVAQTALGMLTVGAAISEVDWVRVGSVALVAGIYSLITSLAGLPELDPTVETTEPTYEEFCPEDKEVNNE